MCLFFPMIPEPLKQHPILKKIIHSADIQGFEQKLPDPIRYFEINREAYKVQLVFPVIKR